MANIIEVDTGTLATSVMAIESLIEQIRACKRALIDHMMQIDAMWDGPANAEFIRQYAIDDSRLTELCNTLQFALNHMDSARNGYDECEEDVASIVASVSI